MSPQRNTSVENKGQVPGSLASLVRPPKTAPCASRRPDARAARARGFFLPARRGWPGLRSSQDKASGLDLRISWDSPTLSVIERSGQNPVVSIWAWDPFADACPEHLFSGRNTRARSRSSWLCVLQAASLIRCPTQTHDVCLPGKKEEK